MYNLVLDKKFMGPARNFSPIPVHPGPGKLQILVPIPSQSRRDRDHFADPYAPAAFLHFTVTFSRTFQFFIKRHVVI